LKESVLDTLRTPNEWSPYGRQADRRARSNAPSQTEHTHFAPGATRRR
jgi:hypothetical protein